jgi:starch-binding outer membrane protein, SusD/RagB family
MNIPMNFPKITGRLAVAAALISVAGLAACNQDELLTVPTPDIVLPGDISGPSALPNAYAAALGDFQVAFSGSSGSEGQVIFSGLLSDELMNAETFPTRLEVDYRDIDIKNSSLLPIFQNAQRARATAELVANRYIEFDPTNPNRAEVQALAGFMYILFAENYCNGVPQSSVNPDGSFNYGDPQTGNQLLNAAIAKFDSAITVATAAGSNKALNLARIGKGRALLDLNQKAAAAAAVAAVPSNFNYSIQHDENTTRQYNGIYSFTVSSKRFTVSNSEGSNGIPFVTLNDPRVPVVRTANGFDGATPFWRTPKYTSLAGTAAGYIGGPRGAPVPLALGTEARLIEAENYLGLGDDPNFLASLNAARASAKTYADTIPPRPAPAALTIADLGIDQASRVNLLFRERALDLYLTSHRLGDLRRLIKYYNRSTETVFPTGVYNPVGAAAGNNYGTDVNFPIPFEETNNPKYSACLDRAP